MSQALRRRTLNTYLVMLFLPVILAGISFWAGYQHRQTVAWVSHTKDVLASIDKVLVAVLAAESTQRGYLLTADDFYYQHYVIRREEAKQALLELRRLTLDNTHQHDKWQQLNDVVLTRFDRLETVIAQRRANGIGQGSMQSELAVGSRMMASIRAAMNTMRAEENRLLQVRDQQQHRAELFVAYSFVLAVGGNIVLLYWAYQLLKQYSLKRDIAELQIRRLNSELELRVAERTAELQAANSHLSRSNEDLSRFAYIASHDLQEPLRTIGSYAGLLARRYESTLDDQAKKYIGFLVEGAKRMQTLVQDLLAYSKAGTQPLHCELVDFKAVVQKALANLEAAIAESGAEIHYGDLPRIRADEPKMVMVFQNLIGNAIKFSKPGEKPLIHIECSFSGSDYVISIRDNGIGFESEYAERIFIVFQRLHSLGVYPGNGIGLAICKRLVEGHGGKIWVDTKLGEGSVFSISMPSSPQPVQ